MQKCQIRPPDSFNFATHDFIPFRLVSEKDKLSKVSVLCRLSIYSQSQSISINFNPFQSLSIPNLNGDWDWIVNPIFWGRLRLSQSQSFTFANRWFCPIYVSEIHKKVLCQNSQMLDLSYHISSEYTFSFSCLPQWARKYRKSSYSAVFFSKEGSRLDCRSHF